MLNFNEKQLEAVCEDFFNLTKLKIVLYDSDFKLVYTSKTFAPFCTLLRRDACLEGKCIECDRYGLNECKKQNRLVVYKCHMGLTEACVPITQNQVVIGYLMLGQTLEKADLESIKEKIAELEESANISRSELCNAIDIMKPISKKSLNSAARLMEMCACYLWINNIVRVQQSTLQNHIVSFINENLSSDELCVDGLCKRFNVSRSLLYTMAKQELGMGISEYVRKCRIENAKRLLLKTNLPICQIASECGFNTPSYFTKVFYEQVGCLPKNYADVYEKQKNACGAIENS